MGVLCVLWLAGAPTAFATGSPEAGRYSFEAFAPQDAGTRLPPELLRSVPAGQATVVASDDETVEISWEAREPFGLAGYRVTTLVQGPGLAPVVARWTIDPWSGEPGRFPRARLYRLRLPLVAPGAVRLRTTLEALRAEGPSVLLGVRDSLASPAKGNGALESTQSPRLERQQVVVAGVSPREGAALPTPPASELRRDPATLIPAAQAAARSERRTRREARGPPPGSLPG